MEVSWSKFISSEFIAAIVTSKETIDFPAVTVNVAGHAKPRVRLVSFEPVSFGVIFADNPPPRK